MRSQKAGCGEPTPIGESHEMVRGFLFRWRKGNARRRWDAIAAKREGTPSVKRKCGESTQSLQRKCDKRPLPLQRK